jgi:hypothetical protein
MQNRPQISIPSVTPATPKTPVESGKQGVKFSSFSPPQISTPQVMPKKRGRPPGSKNKDTDSAKKRKLETGAAKETNSKSSVFPFRMKDEVFKSSMHINSIFYFSKYIEK